MSSASYKELHITRFLSRELNAISMKSGMVILRFFFITNMYMYIFNLGTFNQFLLTKTWTFQDNIKN